FRPVRRRHGSHRAGGGLRLRIWMVDAAAAHRQIRTSGAFAPSARRVMAMLITVFRSRLRPGVTDEYSAADLRMSELAQTMPGYISQKTFTAPDGERCTIVEFENEEGLKAWAAMPSISRPRRTRG